MIIAPSFSKESVLEAQRLRTKCPAGTEAAFIEASTFLWLCRQWHQQHAGGDRKPLPWEILAVTGKLSGESLKIRLESFV